MRSHTCASGSRARSRVASGCPTAWTRTTSPPRMTTASCGSPCRSPSGRRRARSRSRQRPAPRSRPNPRGNLRRARAALLARALCKDGRPAMASLPFDDANMPVFTVGQVAEMLEVQQAFLRRLDEFRVVRPSRSAGGQRRYTRNEIVIVRYVAELMDDGLTLAAVRRVLQLEERVRELEGETSALRAELARLRAAGQPPA